jgi:putative transposase
MEQEHLGSRYGCVRDGRVLPGGQPELNERHLRQVLREYVLYYNDTRPHRTLALEPPEGARIPQQNGAVIAIPILGGLHHRYERKAA